MYLETKQVKHPSLLTENFFNTEGLQVIILANEIPFVGDDPVSIQEKAEKVDFLKDHWPYNLADLVRILDLCFTWKSQGRISA